MRKFFMLALVIGLAVLSARVSVQDKQAAKGGDDYTGAYNVVPKWPLPSRLAICDRAGSTRNCVQLACWPKANRCEREEATGGAGHGQ